MIDTTRSGCVNLATAKRAQLWRQVVPPPAKRIVIPLLTTCLVLAVTEHAVYDHRQDMCPTIDDERCSYGVGVGCSTGSICGGEQQLIRTKPLRNPSCFETSVLPPSACLCKTWSLSYELTQRVGKEFTYRGHNGCHVPSNGQLELEGRLRDAQCKPTAVTFGRNGKSVLSPRLSSSVRIDRSW